MVQQIAYISFSRSNLDQVALRDILEISERNNGRDEITGILMYHDQIFFQVLEGEADAVQKCYKRITQDNRHGIIYLISDKPVGRRSFSNWRMGYAGPDRIGQYTRRTFPDLADLINNEGKTEVISAGAVTLARGMLHEFEAKASQRSLS